MNCQLSVARDIPAFLLKRLGARVRPALFKKGWADQLSLNYWDLFFLVNILLSVIPGLTRNPRSNMYSLDSGSSPE